MLKKNKILPFGQGNANLPETSENNEPIDNSIIHWDTLPTIEEITTTAYTSDGLAIDFTHPGIFVNSKHLHTMREMIHEGYDPWFSAFEDFRVLPRASRDFVPRNVNRIATYISTGDRMDAQAAYSQAVMWWVTGDRVYHDNAIDILRSYIESYDPYLFATMHPGYSPSGVWTGGYGWSAEIITAGMIIQYFSFAAEILRYAEPGEYLDNRWTDEDTQGFLDLLEMTFPIYDRVIKWMNQDGFTFQGMIASAIFQNDADMLVTAIERATVNSESPYTFASGSIKWQMREVTHTACIESFNRGDFPVDIIEVEPQIQVAEMGRQQAYGLVNVELLQSIAQMAHVQGIMINEQGQIVTDGSGTNLFNFLDNRLLQGSNYYFRHNLGYDVLWHPIAKGNSSDFAELQPIRGTENTPGWWVVADHGNRFRLGAAGVLYNYYLYEEEWDRDHEWLRYVVQAHEFSGDLWSGDSINETNMLIAHPDRQTGVAQGPPQRIEAPTYVENVLGSDRIQFTDYTGAIAHRQTSLSPSRIPLQDEQGLRQVLNNLFAGDFIWFRDIDLTGVNVENFILRFASNQGPSGAGFRLLLLDDVEVADWNNLTRAEIDQGTVLVDSTMPTTGWWSNFETEVYEMSLSLNGVHSVVFLLTSSSNAFQLTGDMDWFSFGNFYAYESNSLTTATFTNGITIDGNGRSVLEDGAIFGFEQMNMDIGNSGLRLEEFVTTDSEGQLHLYVGSPGSGERVATYSLPNTRGSLLTLNIESSHVYDTVMGRNDIYYVFEGASELGLGAIASYVVVDRNIPPIPGESFDVITTGNPERVTEDGTTFARLSDGDIVFYRRVNINSDWMAYRVRTDGPVTITLTSGMANMGDRTLQQVWNDSGIARHELIDTGGQWQNIIMDTSGITNRAPHMALMVTGANVDIDYIYFPTTENLILDQIISEPRNFTAVAGDGEVALSWIEPSVGSAFIIGYEVSMDGGQTWLVPDTDRNHTFTGLTNRQIYHFRVRGIAEDFNGFAAAAQAEPVRQFTLAPTYATHVQAGANADRIFNEPTMGRSIAGAGRVAYLKFDLTEFDLGNYEYVDAQLNLTIQGGVAGGFIFAESEDVLRDNQTSWTINNINYNNQPHIIESTPTIRSPHHAMNISTYTDLSQIFNHAIREGRESISIQVTSDTGAGRDFANTRNDNTSHHPRLTITLG